MIKNQFGIKITHGFSQSIMLCTKTPNFIESFHIFIISSFFLIFLETFFAIDVNSLTFWTNQITWFKWVGSNLLKGDLPNHNLPTQNGIFDRSHKKSWFAKMSLRRPLGRRVAQYSLRSQTFGRPSIVLLFYCWSLHIVVKTTFWQIAHVTNIWQIVIRQIA